MAKKKSIYVHYDPEEVTKRYDLTASRTAADVIADIRAQLADAPGRLKLTSDEGHDYPNDADLYAAAAHGDDVFVVPGAATKSVVFSLTVGNFTTTVDTSTERMGVVADASVADVVRLAKTVPESPAIKVDGNEVAMDAAFYEAVQDGADVHVVAAAPAVEADADESEEEEEADADADAEKNMAEELALLKKYLEMGNEALMKGAYARAIEVFSKLQGAVPQETQSARSLCIAYMKARKYKEATQAYEHLVKIVKESADPEYLEMLLEYTEALVRAGMYERGVQVCSHAIRMGNTTGAPQGIMDDLKAMLGHAYFAKGESKEGLSAAAALWTDVLQRTAQTHVQAMLGYTKVLKATGNDKSVIRGLLNILVTNTNNKEIKTAFGNAMRETPDSLKTLLKDVPLKAEKGSASAYGFLALVMKDGGAIQQSIDCYKKSVELDPDNASLALNLFHTLDIDCRYWEALTFGVDFCRRHRDLGVSAGGHRVTCGDVLAIIEGPAAAGDRGAWFDGDDAKAFGAGGMHVRWRDDGVVLTSDAAAPAATDATVPENLRAADGGGDAGGHGYKAEELDLLALWFAAAKKLFMLGCLSALPKLLVLLDPLRRGKELHKTLIRNEQAYFCAVAQLLQHIAVPRPPLAKHIYMCGDSHSLTPSWHTLQYKGEEHLLVNALVTGLKCWHLRDGSHFYPKYNFMKVTDSIPKGSTVVMMFGEIDCREGILFAVEKGHYASVAEGMQVTIDIYIENLLKLQKAKGFEIFVHPALPVLDVTRHLVCEFNEHLAKTLRTNKKVKANGKIRWLDFYTTLLTDDKKALKEEYKLDGTHINPAYLSEVQRALDKAAA